MLDDILLQVYKPARYIGEEWNIARKDFAKAEVNFALGFPDLYEVGMSNLGLRILYGILNNIPGVSCERFFSPADDLEKILRQTSCEMLSLESKKSLKEFDIIGFSLGSELCYTNVLNLLELANIPLETVSRDNAYPLLIGGGPAVMNPEPMHAFFDLFVIGEAEDLIAELVSAFKKFKNDYKTGQMSKQELLLELAKIEGVYVPSFYETVFNNNGGLAEFKPKIDGAPLKIKKRVVQDLNTSFFPVEWLVPYIQIIHDRISLEIMRGCPNRCRFCQARSQYYPLRQRSVENILKLAGETYKQSGYEEISLCGLSVSDYTQMEQLLPQIVSFFKPYAVGVSLPSLKAKALVGSLSSLIATIKKTGLTFAPEAGSERLRAVLGKDFDEKEFFQAIEEAFAAGYQHVKLYFMIGLPGETNEDLDAIVDLSRRVSGARKKIGRGAAQVNISINALAPKPHTVFQWLKMEEQENIKSKQDYLRDKIKNDRKLKLSFHNRTMSFLEAVLSRGDRKLSEVIGLAFKKGARFDAWSDHFNLDRWLEAFKEVGVDPQFYLQEKREDEFLPWDFVDIGISKESLREEFNKFVAIAKE